MSHPEQLEFIQSVKKVFESNFSTAKVLEIGSLNINGSIRQFFDGCDYIGIDVGGGRDVDIVCGGHEYAAPKESYDTIISCECFEHNPYWMETFINMHRMCKVGGLMIMTCATTGRAEHGTTRTTPLDSPLTLDWNYYKNLTENDFTKRLNLSDLFSKFKFDVDQEAYDLRFYGIKKSSLKKYPKFLIKHRSKYLFKMLIWQIRKRVLGLNSIK